MHGNTAQQSKRKAAAWIYMLAAMLFLLTGCGTGSVFDGSRVANASEFQMEYSALNREEAAELVLQAGEQLRVTLSHTEGTVDVTVGMNGKEPIYRGNGQQNAGETGSKTPNLFWKLLKQGTIIFPFRVIRRKVMFPSPGFLER